MLRFAALAAAVIPLAAGCDDGDGAAIAELARFDLDVVVTDFGLEIRFRNIDGATCVPDRAFTRPGECEASSDQGECPVMLACLERVAVERGGIEIASTSTEPPFLALGVFDPGLFARGDADLVIRGCGGELRMPIAASVIAPPTLAELTTDGTYVRGTRAPASGTGTWAVATTTLTSTECHTAGDAAWRVGPFERDEDPVDLSIAAIDGGSTRPTPWGEATLWSRRLGSPVSTRIAVPRRGADGRWRVDATEVVRGTWTVDGSRFLPLAIEAWGFRITPAGPRIHLERGGTSYVAGDPVDTLSLELPDGIYRGTVAHAAPLDDLDLGLAEARLVELAIGPVTVTHETNPSLTHEVSLDAAWTYPVVPRPEP